MSPTKSKTTRSAEPKAEQPETVFLRIKRFGKEWATCGIGISPPPSGGAYDPRMKKLCPKLVPGQVIELPVTHPLVKKRSKLVEIVDGPEKDEFIRPWVFHSAEEAAMANPSKSRLGPEQILDGLTLREGAIRNAPIRREKARAAAREEDGFETGQPSGPDDYEEPEYEDVRPISDDELAERSQNRVKRDEYEDARPIGLADPEPEEADEPPAPRPRRRTRL
jgi:hypothetical protein